MVGCIGHNVMLWQTLVMVHASGVERMMAAREGTVSDVSITVALREGTVAVTAGTSDAAGRC